MAAAPTATPAQLAAAQALAATGIGLIGVPAMNLQHAPPAPPIVAVQGVPPSWLHTNWSDPSLSKYAKRQAKGALGDGAPEVPHPPAPPDFWMWSTVGLKLEATHRPPSMPGGLGGGAPEASRFELPPGKPPKPPGQRKAEREIKLGIEATFQPPAAPLSVAPATPPVALDLRAPETGAGRESAATSADRTVAGGRGAGLDALRDLVVAQAPPSVTEAAAPGPA